MMTQEEFMDVLAMKRVGMTYTEIASETGYHPATIAKWCRQGGPPAARTVGDDDRVVDPKWADRLNSLLIGNTSLLATSLFEIVRAEGVRGFLSDGGALGACPARTEVPSSRFSECADRDRPG